MAILRSARYGDAVGDLPLIHVVAGRRIGIGPAVRRAHAGMVDAPIGVEVPGAVADAIGADEGSIGKPIAAGGEPVVTGSWLQAPPPPPLFGL